MMHSRIIQMVAIPAGILLLAGKAIALFGFGKQSAGPTTEEAEAKSRAVEMIRASIAADDFVPPAKGVKRQDAKKFIEARELGNFSCGESVVAWDRVNDDWCDCSDGSDEPGTSACSKGVFECVNRGHRALRLPSSRVGDSVCDCCDGSDEPRGLCKPTCEEESEAWVTRLAESITKADRGVARREEYARQASEAAEERGKRIEEARSAIEEVRGELDHAKETLKDLEQKEGAQRESKLAEAEKVVLERTRSVELTPDRIAALAVAVASAEDPFETLEELVQGVLDGEDISDLLKGLLGNASAKDKRSSSRNREESSFSEDEEDLLRAEDEDSLDDADMDHVDHYADMHLDDDYGYGGYDGYGGYGDYYGHGDLDHGLGLDGDTESTNDVPVPDEDAGQASAIKNSRIAVDDSDERGEPDNDEMKEIEEELEKEEAFKPPHQFKKFKYELPEAVEGRSWVKELGNDVKAQEKNLKALEDEASIDFGADGVLWPLKDKCITTRAAGYDYTVCPFKDAHQGEGGSKSKARTSIGKWKGIERVATDQKHLLEDSGARSEDDGDQPLLSGDMLVFDRGQKCWNGPARSLRVALACGPDDVLSAVEEPETCAYTAVLETPAACSADMKNVLLRGATGTRSAAKGDSEGTASDKFRSIDQGIEDEL
ncbi:unnamed protein product [Ascophyllum nodosum]